MEHLEIESLLGAYALDAVDPDEARLVEAHLRDCATCRGEVASYREIASLLGNSTDDAPEGGWQELVTHLNDEQGAPSWSKVAAQLPRQRVRKRRRVTAGIVVGIAAAAIAVLGVRVATLDDQLHGQHEVGLAQAVAGVLQHNHQIVTLTSTTRQSSASVAIAPNGDAYWVSSNLPSLPSNRTYQLWALSRGEVVSLGVIGNDPHHYAAFMVQKTMSALMVSAEPQGGTAKPTTPVLVSASVVVAK